DHRRVPRGALAELLALFFPQGWRRLDEVQAGAAADPPRQAAEHGGGELAFARADFDEIPAAGFTEGRRGPGGNRLSERSGKNRRGREISALSDSLDSPRVVAALRVMECP